ncbi:MAG TPA: cytochrome c [Terriglobales bacterium]
MKVRSERSDVRKAWFVILLFAACASLVAQESAKSSSGKATFKSKCVLCHGLDGSGNTPLGKQLQAANLRSKDVQKLSDEKLHQVVHDGQANMPSFADQLSDDEINQVIKYVRVLGRSAKTAKK